MKYQITKKNILEFVGFKKSKRRYKHLKDAKILIDNIEYTIPKGFEFDGWSIPFLIDMFFDLVRDVIPSAWHDWFYANAGLYPKITRRIADSLLKQIALDRGCQKREVYIAYYTVRIFSGGIWKRYKRKNLKNDS